MIWTIALAVMLGTVCALLALGLPVAIAFFSANVLGSQLFLGGLGSLSSFPSECLEAIGKFSLTPIPLFVLMGELLFHTGLAFKAIDAIDRLITRVPGRLSVVALCGGTLFASLSGSTIANTALLGNVMLPRMLELKYDARLAMGPIMAVGGIAMLIPPSALAVLLASLAEQSIAALLIAGIVPGILMAGIFIVYVMGRCILDPRLAPEGTRTGARQWRPLFVYVLPLFGIFAVVIGSMFGGIASPTEAAALGCTATLVACLLYRAVTWRSLAKAGVETAKISVMILFIIAGSLTFAQILAISGATNGFLDTIQSLNLSDLALVLMMIGVLLFLGCFMDQISMILLTLPFFIPLATSHKIDMVWLLLLILIAMEVSLLTPPFGLLLFVMKGVAPRHITMMQVYSAALPFVALKILVLALLVAMPALATWLPRLIL
jgi:tripartite ATP-independent transporter DctM subunit